MKNKTSPTPGLKHGARDLPSVRVASYGAKIFNPGGKGFLGDRVNSRSFIEILDQWRMRASRGKEADDPLEDTKHDDTPTAEIARKELDILLAAADTDPRAAGLVHSAIEEFAQELAVVIRRFLRLKDWRGTERIAVGGGFLGARVGAMAVGRVGIILNGAGQPVDMVTISRDPDHAALCGAAHLFPVRELKGSDALLAVDIGGSNIRAGLVELRLDKAGDLSRARVVAFKRWQHREEKGATREEALDRLKRMLRKLARHADRKGLRLAPFIGVGCPGEITAEGVIKSGGQNLPGGNWEDQDFNLVQELAARAPKIDGKKPVVRLHNDAVVQGLSEQPNMLDVKKWAVLTIGTGLGNARFSNRKRAKF